MTSVMAEPTPEKSGPAGKPIGGKAAAPGGPKPASAVTKPPAGAAPPKPAAPGARPAGAAGAGAKKEGDFKVIRSAPAAAEGGSATPLLIGGAVIALAIGGYFVVNRKGPDKPPPPVTSTDGTSPSTETAGPEVPHPDAVDERLEFLVNEGRLKDALAYAEEKLKEYPNAKLRARRDELRAKVGGGAAGSESTGESPEALLAQAEAALTRGNAAEALAKLDDVLGRDGLPEAVAGRAYYLRALTNIRSNDLLAADSDVNNAASNNYDPQKCDELRAQIAAQQPR